MTALHKTIAFDNTVLLTEVGSGLFGVKTPGLSDRDEMGVCIEPREYVIGLHQFEQYAPAKDGRSGPDDIDFTIYSLRKWARLAAKGNPTVLLLLFAPQAHWVKSHWPAYSLQDNAELFISQACAGSFIGYLDSQHAKMTGERCQHTNRPELIALHGFDTKFAYHAVRLGLQGIELLSTGRMTLPIPEPDRSWLIELRNGEHTKDEAIERILDCREQIKQLEANNLWPKLPDADRINEWLIETYQNWWELKA